MPDTIGRITVPTVINSGQTFPLTTQFPFGFSVERPVIVHRFGTLDAKQEQRYYAGIGPRKFQFRRPNLNWNESRQLKAFWESMQGSWMAFTYDVPNPDGTTTPTLVTFEQAPISFDYLRSALQVGLNFVEVVDPTQAPTCPVNSTCVRFPSSTLSTALLSEVQQIIPLVHIRVRESAVPDIYLSDRRVTLSDNAGGAVQITMGWTSNSQLYLPRLIGIGEPGSDVVLSQEIRGSSDNVKFSFGNADRVMTALANDTDLKYAEIDLCLFHVNSGIVLQLWKGVIQNYTSDGTPNFPVTCSDGFFQIMNQYPERLCSRQCWKPYNDGVNCPFSTKGALDTTNFPNASGSSCDYYLESANGCQAHGMAKYFGGQQADPQGVIIKDDSTGFLGFGRNKVTATSILSETIWGLALPEIWCNSGGNPLLAFIASALMVAYRDESGYSDSFGILGAGPLGGFSPSCVVKNADGLPVIVAPLVDGYTWQGLKVDGNLNVTKYQPGMGLRYIPGDDPANEADSFSLGQGTPQQWEANIFAAGTAACEIRIVKSTTIQPSTPDQHQMTVPIDFGMWGWVWDSSGNRSAVKGLINPFWIAVNMLLRALALYGDPSTGSNPAGGAGPASADQLATFVLSSLVAGDGSGAAEIAAARVAPILGAQNTTWYSITPAGAALSGAQVNLNPDGSYSFPYYDADGTFTILSIDDALSAGYVTQESAPVTETQFQFQGSISSQKPFRDWLTEVLNCCLGFYTWEFGKLKLGCRSNASAVDAYGLGSILFQTLRLTPIQAAFERLILSYADVAYQFQANTAEYCDKSHAAYYGRTQSPLTSQMHSVGISTLSQALRVAATRTREEIGGVRYTEWRDARNVAWQTTLLGLGNEVGQVVSMTHPDIPGLHGTCNVTGTAVTWASGDDWNDSLYTLADGTWASSLVNKEAMVNGVQVLISAATIANGQAGSTTASVTALTIASTGTGLPANGNGVQFQIITMSLRIQRWSLKKDWSVEIQGQTVTESMYDLDVGLKPMDVRPAPLPSLSYPVPLGPVWAPYQVQAPANDALFPNEWNFDPNQEYTTMADGSALASLLVTGKLPVNEFSATGAGAPGIGSIARSRTGGSLPANSTLRVALCAIDSSGLPSAPSNILIVGTSASGTDLLTVEDITWPAVSGLVSYVLFVATQDDLICAQATGSLTAGPNNTYTPNSITFNGPLVRSTWAFPSPYVSKVRIKAKRVIHSGVIGAQVTSPVTGDTIVCTDLVDTHTPAFNPVGRILSVIGRPESSTPFVSFTITAFDPATGTLTASPSPTTSGHPELSIQQYDVIVIRNKADAANTGDPTQITDSGYQNVTNGYNGMTTGGEVGNVLRVIAGTGRGQLRKITANTATQLSWDLPLVLDQTSVWIVEAPAWAYVADTASIENGDPSHAATLNIPTDNFVDQPLVIAGFTVDVNGNESPDGDVPIREDWIFGAEGQAHVSGFTLPVSGVLGIQSDAAPAFYLDNDFTAGSVKAYVKSAPVGVDLVFTIYAGDDAWMTLTIPSGSTSVAATAAQVDAAAVIPANTNLRLAITAVGTTYPGSDLSVFVYA